MEAKDYECAGREEDTAWRNSLFRCVCGETSCNGASLSPCYGNKCRARACDECVTFCERCGLSFCHDHADEDGDACVFCLEDEQHEEES